MSYTPEQLTTLQHVVQDMDGMRDRRLRELGPDEVLGEPEPDVVKVRRGRGVQVCAHTYACECVFVIVQGVVVRCKWACMWLYVSVWQ